ncbi:metallo-beta-lactamase [Bacillus sp. FJAT-18017]|uniref:MBL fold metallo-hydrolase n=1 Tax=Bacillus sp. FJAT-18017 TaxID=1705566 RepID=UPI0006AF6535|nr:MBL fold metallo-hydrolase [Bacillus sp. FJAT-18017]ALC92409.1 metallo-beta-lactamase [Bacillus sp. FJAT-18017]
MDYKFENSILPLISIGDKIGINVLDDVYMYTTKIVNLFLIGNPETEGSFSLIDSGMPKCADEIIKAVEDRFGKGAKPASIILTHGHFDHVGSLAELLERWEVPVYAHRLELPYLTGRADYPKGDPETDGGLVSELSPLFPNHGINLGNRIEALPNNGGVPGLEEWIWVHTPGHTPGHISLFRERDRSLIAGDAFVTVKQESLYKVLTQTQEISGPPKYYTTDWEAAYQSVKELLFLKPVLAVTGHGLPMNGDELVEALDYLVSHFNQIAVPEHGKFVRKGTNINRGYSQ